MGAPLGFAEKFQAGAGLGHIMTTLDVLKSYPFEEPLGTAMLVREPVGVVGMITPWNWPLNQIACKVAPALAAGCTMVLKPSEYTPTSALIFAEILHEAGVPKGVFNLVNGLGPEVGAAMSTHPGIDMVSFTGSTRAGIDVVQKAAPTVKRVTPGARRQVAQHHPGGCRSREGHRRRHGALLQQHRPVLQCADAHAGAARQDEGSRRHRQGRRRQGQARRSAGGGHHHGPGRQPRAVGEDPGPIKKGIDEGATLVAGGLGRPEGLNKGFYVRPTVFADVTNDMTIAREEIFGPVLSIIGYKDEDDAVRIANDTPYGLAGYVSGGNVEHARRVARRIRAGNVNLNGAPERARRALRRLQAVGQRPRVGPLRRRGIPRGQGRRGLGRVAACHPGELRARPRACPEERRNIPGSRTATERGVGGAGSRLARFALGRDDSCLVDFLHLGCRPADLRRPRSGEVEERRYWRLPLVRRAAEDED